MKAWLLLIVLGVTCTLSAPAVGQDKSLATDLESLELESLLNQSVSTASKYKQSVSEAPASVTIVTSEQIRRFGYRSLAEVLNAVPGFFVSHDHVQNYVGTRGFGRMWDFNNRVLLLLNGHTINERAYGIAYIDEALPVNMSAIERVEIVRGPGSVLYGTGAMFGVINIVTKDPTDFEGLEVSLGTGNYGRRMIEATASHAFANGLHVFTTGMISSIDGRDLYFSEFDSPATNNGWAIARDWSETLNGFLSVGFHGWRLQGLMMRAESGVPNAEYGSLFNNENAEFDNERRGLELARDFDLGYDKSLELRTFYDEMRIEFSHPIQMDIERLNLQDALIEHVLEGRIKTLGAESNLQWALRQDNHLIVGAQYFENFYVRLRADATINEDGSGGLGQRLFEGLFPFRSLSLYAQDEFQVRSNFALTLGLRHDLLARHSRVTPRAAIVYHAPWGGSLKALYGEAFRDPSSQELHFESDMRRLVKNTRLRPETSRTAELVYEQSINKRWNVSASVYDYRVKGLIISVPMDDTEGKSQLQNIEQVGARGIELQLEGRLTEHLEVAANYGYQYGRQINPDAGLQNAPAHLLKARMAVDDLPFGNVGLSAYYESGRLTTQRRWTDAFLLVDVHVVSRPLWDRLSFSLLARNLLDADHVLPAGPQHQQETFVLDGRRLEARATLSF